MTLREEVEQAVKELMFSYAYRGALYLEGSKPDILPVPISSSLSSTSFIPTTPFTVPLNSK